MQILRKTVLGSLFLLALVPTILFAETVGVFFDSTVAQSTFAAGDIKNALESKSFTVEMLPLASLSASYAKKKVVVALASNTSATGVLTTQNGSIPTGLGEQAYALRTTATPQTSYWALGGDTSGAMYGGLQIADNIKFSQFAGTYNSQESPTILKRGIKLNLPWDKNSGTYGKFDMGTFDGTSVQLAIKDVWDMSFWTTWFDEMARNRYNVISLWSCNPFSSLVSVPGYEDCSIQNVTYYDGTVKTMTIDEKITFWRQVMAYAHARGFEFLLFNWNVFTYGATGKHGITDGSAGASDADTRDYMYKAMTKLLETYPDFDGFGMSIGENSGTESFVWNTYGKALYDYALAHPQRKLRFVHRFHYAGFSEMATLFAPLRTLSNVTLDMSIKRSYAHMYATAVPTWYADEYNTCRNNNFKTWCTVRNDEMYYLTWGDPSFARAYINGMVDLGTVFRGFYMGSDGYNPTRTFFSKNSVTQGILEVQRQQYMMMLWGRLSYNPNTPDDVFKNYMAVKYPAVSSQNLFDAWRKGSRGIQLMSELVVGSWFYDFYWYPEACLAGRGNGFRTIGSMGGCVVTPGSNLCAISNSASNSCGTKKTSYQVADSIETSSQSALSLLSTMSAGANTELGVTLNNIKALSYLGLYYAEKIRGATYNRAGNTTAARDAMGRAYCKWMDYANLMDAMFTGMNMQRVDDIANWHSMDTRVLAEYTGLGGTGTPGCQTSTISPAQVARSEVDIVLVTRNAAFCRLPSRKAFTMKIYNCKGATIMELHGMSAGSGLTRVPFNTRLAKGTLIVCVGSEPALQTMQVSVIGE